MQRRLIRINATYTIDEDVELELPQPTPEPDVEIQGEPWGWLKPGRKPLGWRRDGNYGSD